MGADLIVGRCVGLADAIFKGLGKLSRFKRLAVVGVDDVPNLSSNTSSHSEVGAVTRTCTGTPSCVLALEVDRNDELDDELGPQLRPGAAAVYVEAALEWRVAMSCRCCCSICCEILTVAFNSSFNGSSPGDAMRGAASLLCISRSSEAGRCLDMATERVRE